MRTQSGLNICFLPYTFTTPRKSQSAPRIRCFLLFILNLTLLILQVVSTTQRSGLNRCASKEKVTHKVLAAIESNNVHGFWRWAMIRVTSCQSGEELEITAFQAIALLAPVKLLPRENVSTGKSRLTYLMNDKILANAELAEVRKNSCL